MWTPDTIDEWLNERIGFIENILSSNKETVVENPKQVSDFTFALQNFKYCKKLHLELLKDPNDGDVKRRLRNIANKLIFDTVYELDKQEYKCTYIHEFCFPTKEKIVLPQENIDYISKIRVALENIFYQVKRLCDGNGYS